MHKIRSTEPSKHAEIPDLGGRRRKEKGKERNQEDKKHELSQIEVTCPCLDFSFLRDLKLTNLNSSSQKYRVN